MAPRRHLLAQEMQGRPHYAIRHHQIRVVVRPNDRGKPRRQIPRLDKLSIVEPIDLQTPQCE
jgi:hypothetical protein